MPLHASDWVPRSIQELPMLTEDDHANIFLLQAPLLKWKLGDLLAQLNMTHGAIGIQTVSATNQSNNLYFSVEYDGIPEMWASIFPKIVNGTLEWNNFGGAMIYYPVNESYYSTGITKVGEISGLMYNKFVHYYIARLNETKVYYQMLSVVDAATREEYLPSYDCFDMVYEALEWLITEAGMKLIPEAKVFKCWTDLITSHEPQFIDNADEWHADILRFFELIEFKFSDLSIIDAIIELRDLVVNKYVYLRVKDVYFRVKLTSPFLELRYEEVPVKHFLGWYRGRQAARVKR